MARRFALKLRISYSVQRLKPIFAPILVFKLEPWFQAFSPPNSQRACPPAGIGRRKWRSDLIRTAARNGCISQRREDAEDNNKQDSKTSHRVGQ